VARDHPQSGSAASWTALIAPRAARWLGWMTVLYYLTNFVLQPVTFGLFFRDLLGAGPWAYAAGAILCCALPAVIAYRGITPSTQGAVTFLVIETVVVAALCLTAAFFNPGRAEPLSPRGFGIPPEGLSGIAQAMVFTMLSFCGFDVVSTLSEEAKMAPRLIPQATILCLLLFGAFVIGGIWCLTYAMPEAKLREILGGGGSLPITEVARAFWGRGAVLVVVTGLSAALGIAIATAVGASRVLFAMGRGGLAPALFGRVHEVRRVPWNAMHLVFGAGLLGALAAGALIGPYRAYLWWGTTSTFFAMVTFVFVNLANLILNRGRARTPLGFLLYAAVPLSGIGVDLVILYRSFFVELWAQGWAAGRSAIAFDVACALLALLALRVKRAEPAPSPP